MNFNLNFKKEKIVKLNLIKNRFLFEYKAELIRWNYRIILLGIGIFFSLIMSHIKKNSDLVALLISIFTGFLISTIFYYISFWLPYKNKMVIFNILMTKKLCQIFQNFSCLYLSLKENKIYSSNIPKGYKFLSLGKSKQILGKDIFDFFSNYSYKQYDLNKFQLFLDNHNRLKSDLISYLIRYDCFLNNNDYYQILMKLEEEDICKITNFFSQEKKITKINEEDLNFYKNLFELINIESIGVVEVLENEKNS